ncbi:hypothetical protein CHS0354_005613 [Potamilus streckersoni]|uniref:Uncharacterized protein n=1 Tax=Potamilus streckersoni TaxID=2493646 RepID=A0AAE0SIE0_9BIVA|nr:hypothetical protein CHS0354_005613 [Potamilus streckersoni]
MEVEEGFAHRKATTGTQNDPWKPLDENNSPNIIKSHVANPLYDLISSDKYIDSLEKKLHRIKGRASEFATSKDMIAALEHKRDAQMQQYMISSNTAGADYVTVDQSSPGFSLQRKLHPEKQFLNPQEIVALLEEDVLAKNFEESQEKDEQIRQSGQNIAPKKLGCVS